MGIQGLLQFIKEASEPIHVKKYKGQVVAVDTYCWLHKGAISCAEKLAKGEPTDRYVGFCMKFVNMLLSHGIKPILIFDGCTLPSKKEVEKTRRERRQANLLKGKQLLREGKVSEARDCFTRSVNITHAMAHKVIKAARAQGVDCLVAPYEADAQLAYLNKAGIVQAIITEDSDLLAFGCKKVILKMDQFGNGLEIDQARFGMCKQLGDGFTEEKFRYMCILSGCDYLSSLRGIGLAKACKVLKLANNPDIIKVIKKIGHYLKMNLVVPEDYIKGFIRANNTFLYQLVFDPIKRKLIPLNAYEDDIDKETLSYAGQYIDDYLALQIALGNKDVNTFEQIDDYNPDSDMPTQSRSYSWVDKRHQKSSVVNSIWHRNYCSRIDVSDDVSSKGKTSTVGIEQVISTNALNLPRKSSFVKRPRNEELSEDDLLRQYYPSFTKKTKKNICEGDKTSNSLEMPISSLADEEATNKKCLSTQPTRRNKFATFLQRKSKERDAVVVPGTRSRFFCSSPDTFNCVPKEKCDQFLDETAFMDKESNLKEVDCLKDKKPVDSDVAQKSDDQIPDGVMEINKEEPQSLETCTFTRTISSPTMGTPRSCFSWSGNLGEFSRTPSPSSATSALRHFHRESDFSTSLPEKVKESNASQLKSNESGDESYSILKVTGSSHSQEHDKFVPQSLNASKPSSLPNKDNDSEVPGLYKSLSMDSLSSTKIKPLVPARVSGLRKNSANIQKRNHHNAENKPGLQTKINDLWKNFGFRKNSEKISSCQKPAPLSPVKDNIQLTPETEDNIFNKSECAHVQRAILQ